MTWLTWRQFRGSAGMMFAPLVVLAALLAVTGPALADRYATGIARCPGGQPERPVPGAASGSCSDFVERFFNDYQSSFLAVTAIVLVLPALVGLFWGAPLIARELEAGTHRLVWNQGVTRTRWLAVKLGLVGLAAMAAAGLGTLAVTWWSGPVDRTAEEFPRLAPMLFAARGVVPIGYAAFAFALGVTVGLLVRRTLPAMALTLAVFVAVQVAMPMLVRPHLLAPVHAAIEITGSNLESFNASGPDEPIRVVAKADDMGAWLLSSHTVDASGRVVDTIPLTPSSPACMPAGQGLEKCLTEITRLGYRQQVTYHPSSRFWPFQWYETGIYLALALGLAGFCFWRIRRDLS